PRRGNPDVCGPGPGAHARRPCRGASGDDLLARSSPPGVSGQCPEGPGHVDQMERFMDDGQGPPVQQSALRVTAEVPAHETAADPGVDGLEGAERLGAVQLRHPDVQKDDVDVLTVPAVEL